MLKVEFDLEVLTAEELIAAEHVLHQDAEVAPAGRHCHNLAELFTAIERAVREEAAIRHALEERHEVAEALGIDETTGEWLAGA